MLLHPHLVPCWMLLKPWCHRGGKTCDMGRTMGDGGERRLSWSVQDQAQRCWQGCGKKDVYPQGFVFGETIVSGHDRHRGNG
jgi:hypothetical protein